MRRRIFGPLLLLCLASASAQSPTVGDAPSGVAIVKFSWYNVTYRQGWDDPPDSAANHTLEDTRSFPAQDSTATQFPRPIGSPSSSSSRARDRSAQSRPASGDEQTPANNRVTALKALKKARQAIFLDARSAVRDRDTRTGAVICGPAGQHNNMFLSSLTTQI